MKDIWQQIEDWIKDKDSDILQTLHPAATKQDITELESHLGVTLPDSFKSFLSIHNGQSWTHLKLFNGDRLLSVGDIANEWNKWKAVMPEIDANCQEQFGEPASSLPDKGIKDNWWNPAWIPITSNGSGDSYCIDLDPTSEGTTGQIIRMWHDVPERELIATSFESWMNQYVSDLKKDVYVTSTKAGLGRIRRRE